MMKLHFDANQEYQLQAVKAAVDLFKGQPLEASDFELTTEPPKGHLDFDGHLIVGNNLAIDEKTLLDNLQVVQAKSGVEQSQALEGLHFSLEMETGTGKTYVYLRTIHELYKTYGFKKFIIVVPSLAIKEGALKNLQITKDHFDLLYENPENDFYVYDPKKRGLSKNFATTNSLQILVMNIDQFARAGNIIYQDSDWGIPIQFIKGTQPIVIVDEPQNMETENRKQAINNLNPLCTLRYSATHKYHYNLIYSLNPVDAYDLGLVKKIEVDGVVTEDAENQAYVQLKTVTSSRNTITAKMQIDVSTREGVQKKEVTVRAGDDLYDLSRQREIYRDGFIVNEMDAATQSITFSNGNTIYAGQTQGGFTEEVQKFMIESTVKNHFDKEIMLKNKGIKVLSLFFIDRVANYREYEGGVTQKGKFALWFEQAYSDLSGKPKYKGVIPYSAEEVHNGYFSQDRKGVLRDTKGESDADDDTYALIMKDKERLLSNDEPLRFIFSHSALREGWDNPNVFQICTLNETQSNLKKRQEIGRGLRLPVNQEGVRVWDSNVNILTITANESYEDFAKSLQAEIQEECGVEFSGRIKDKRKRKKVKIKKQLLLDENFKALWDRIKQKTQYRVGYGTNDLIRRASDAISELTITSPRLVSQTARLSIDQTGIQGSVVSEVGHKIETKIGYIPDILGYIQDKTRLTRDTILKILKQSGKIGDILKNPQQFMDLASAEIVSILRQMMVDGIKYEKIADKYWRMELFEDDELECYLENLFKVTDQSKTLYDYVQIDSSVELQFAKDLEAREDVKFYFKLPFWFKINTPLGTYNPDWAVVFENDKKIYFVAETKADGEELRDTEKMKIKCGKKHFEEFGDVQFAAPVSRVSELRID
jgi:type III restriction enzyme